MLEILAENASALFALAGTLFGGVLSFLSTWWLKKRDLKLRLQEKVLDRRIAAHEKVLDLTKSLRTMHSAGYIENGNELVRFPRLLSSPQAFDEWHVFFMRTVSESSSWLSNDVTRELNLLNDYTANLGLILQEAAPSDYPAIGAIIRNDFITFSSRIEKIAFKFFEKDLLRLKLNSLEKWHKHPPEVTMGILGQTSLTTRSDEIGKVIMESPEGRKLRGLPD